MSPRGAPTGVVHADTDGCIAIELSGAQVNDVVRAASERGQLSVLMSSVEDMRATLAAGCPELQDTSLSRSLILGLLVLACFPTDGGTVRNADIAERLDMRHSTAHRYVTTLVVLGLLEQDPRTRRYSLAASG
jgi:hypothetical protein